VRTATIVPRVVTAGLVVPLASLVAFFLAGCGGGLPLLHPARALPQGEVRAMGGLSGNVVVGSAASSLSAARNEAIANPNVPGAAGTNPTYARGALVSALVAPGLAPVVGARVGIGHGAEGGIVYTGRGVRIDARATIDRGAVTYSGGLGVSAAFYGEQDGTATLPNVNLSQLHGYGADIPLLVGWESTAGLYKFWGGARAGFEHAQISDLTSEPDDAIGAPPISLSGTRFWGGGLLGFAVGFRHLHVAFEMDVAYVSATGQYNETHVSINGVAVTPSSAILWTF
jgi:hypothetical protein